MILWYKFKNFYSFKDETTIDLRLQKNSSVSNFDTNINNYKVSKILAILGANASGKSNLLKPLAFLNWFCNNSFKDQKNEEELPFAPFLFQQDEPSEIEICFIPPMQKNKANCIEFKYKIKLDRKRIYHESLKKKMMEEKNFTNIFSRTYNKKNNRYTYSDLFDKKNVKNSDITSENLEKLKKLQFSKEDLKKVPHNASVLSYFVRLGNIVAETALFSISIRNNLHIYGKYSLNYDSVLDATEIYHKNRKLFKKAINYLKKLNFGLDNIKLKKIKYSDTQTGKIIEKITPFGVHSSNNDSYEIPFYMESTGTQASYCFIMTLLIALDSGGIAVIDELDTDLHPLMVVELIKLFENELINKHNAQLIFSCHNLEILKILKKHHLYLVEKDKNCISESWRLDQIKGLRSQDNLYAKYITGALGGIPETDL